MRRIRTLFKQLLHLNESPHRTAVAFAVGVFIAFSPTYGLHTVSAIVVSWAFRLNFIAVIAGSLINNPWTLVPILGATFWTGFRVMAMPDVPPLDWSDLSLTAIYVHIRVYAFPFFVGGLILSMIGSVMAYPLAYYVISQYRSRKPAVSSTEGRLPRESS